MERNKKLEIKNDQQQVETREHTGIQKEARQQNNKFQNLDKKQSLYLTFVIIYPSCNCIENRIIHFYHTSFPAEISILVHGLRDRLRP